MIIRNCETNADILKTFPVMKQLRTKLENPEAYLAIIKQQQASQQYVLTAMFDDDDNCIAATGYRSQTSLFTNGGAFFYIDDLITDEKHRKQGHGSALITHVKELAKAEDYCGVSLDSGLQRLNAHAFYEKTGFEKTAFHFFRPRSPEPGAGAGAGIEPSKAPT